MIHFKDNKNKSALSTRWAQMTKQEQIIEKKKMEIQAKLEAQRQAAALAAQAKLTNTGTKDDKGTANIFSNDGSFMSQFKALLEKQKQDKEEKEEKEKQKTLEEERVKNEAQRQEIQDDDVDSDREQPGDYHERDHHDRRSGDRSRERHRRWNDRGRNRPHSPMTPVVEDRKKHSDKQIPSLMQIPVMPPEDQSPENSESNWHMYRGSSDDESKPGPSPMGPGSMGPAPMGPGPMGPGPMGPGPMGPGSMGPGPMGPGHIGPGPMGPGPMGPGHMGPMGPGPMGPGPMGPGPMGPGPMGPVHMGPRPNMGPGPGGPIMNMPPGGPMPPRGPMPPFMGGPPNFPMPPNFMGPNGPGPMPPNICGPNMPPGPNGPPMPPFFGSPFSMGPNGPMGPNVPMGPNGPMGPMVHNGPMGPNVPMRPNGPIGPNGPMGHNGPNSMMPPNPNGNIPFMGPRPPFGPNGPNFGNGNGPNMPFMPPNSMPPNTMSLHTIPEPKPLDAPSIPPPEPMKLQNIPPPMPLPLNHIPKPKDLDPGNIPAPPIVNQVLSPDVFPPSVHRAASEVATNGDHWENVLKAIHSQDQNLWFLHNPNSAEYKAFRDLVNIMKDEKKPEVRPEDKYEPEFCMDDDSNDSKSGIKEESKDGYTESQYPWSQVKREHTSSQSDEEPEARRERRKRKKSRWSDEPPSADIKPPGVVMPMPGTLVPAGTKLAKIDEEGIKLSTVNRNNQALMQYALTNYGTTNLSVEDWKKCEDNFKLNLLYQDMLKKRQEVERLAAAGKHKYEYDSDEDTADGTWEHRLRAKEMFATQKWADELTKQAAGKHHIGDFLPPEELKKFMEKYSAVKSGKEPDLSDYKEFKLKEDNLGFKMLQKLGWNEGQGLGAEGTGIVEPINKANQPVANMGLGASASDIVSPEDDEFDAYRKRMMLAYRFRPNPLNNPRRPYY